MFYKCVDITTSLQSLVAWKVRRWERTKTDHMIICIMEATYGLNGTKIGTHV